jgi:hypothetical protein
MTAGLTQDETARIEYTFTEQHGRIVERVTPQLWELAENGRLYGRAQMKAELAPLIEAARAYRDADAALLRTYQSPPNRDHEVVARQHFTRSVARLHEAARTLEGHVEEGTP